MNFESMLNEKIIYNKNLEKALSDTLHTNLSKIIEAIRDGNYKYIERLIIAVFNNNGVDIGVEVELHEDDGEPRGFYYGGVMTINLFHSDRLNNKLMDEIVVTCMHEYIHSKQGEKRKTVNKEKDVDVPDEDRRKFSSHEIMAYANTFTLRAKNAGLTKREVFDLINSGKEVKFDNIFVLYKRYKNRLPHRWFNKFVKYIYYYIEEVYD